MKLIFIPYGIKLINHGTHIKKVETVGGVCMSWLSKPFLNHKIYSMKCFKAFLLFIFNPKSKYISNHQLQEQQKIKGKTVKNKKN